VKPVQPLSATQSKRSKKDDFKTGRWSKEEHFRFLEALKLYSKEWKLVQ